MTLLLKKSGEASRLMIWQLNKVTTCITQRSFISQGQRHYARGHSATDDDYLKKQDQLKILQMRRKLLKNNHIDKLNSITMITGEEGEVNQSKENQRDNDQMDKSWDSADHEKHTQSKTTEQILEKYKDLFHNKRSNQLEEVINTSFGEVVYDQGKKRLDYNTRNKPNISVPPNQKHQKLENFIEDQYFTAVSETSGSGHKFKDISTDNAPEQRPFVQHPRRMVDNTLSSKSYVSQSPKKDEDQLSDSKASEDQNLFDKQYFGEISNTANTPDKNVTFDTKESNYFDQQYFQSEKKSADASDLPGKQISGSFIGSLNEYNHYQGHSTSLKDHQKQSVSDVKQNVGTDGDTSPLTERRKESISDTKQNGGTNEDESSFRERDVKSSTESRVIDEIHTRQTKFEKRLHTSTKPNIENPETAFDYVMKLRMEKREKINNDEETVHPKLKKWKGKLDSKGFRILEEQVINLNRQPQDVVVDIIKNSIIYENEDILVIDKPYGLPSHGGPGVHHSVAGLLNELSKVVPGQKQPLHLIHRLDKETTGVMLLAKKPDVAWKIHGMFKRREVKKTYWVLTKGIPTPDEGVIDIPMIEEEVSGRFRMGLRPHVDQNTRLLTKQSKEVKKISAITNYKVLESNNSAALVECIPETGVKHQIRCHLAFGLNTGILGDHKYSHFSRFAPQKLYPEILEKLKIRQATVRYLPMHLHAKELVLPEFYEGRNSFFKARLPNYFVQNMKWLKISLPK